MAILDSAIKIKNDVVEYISVMKIYKEQNKCKTIINDTTRDILVEIKFINSGDRRFVVISDNDTDEMLEKIKQFINGCKMRSSIYEEMTNFQFCEYIRHTLERTFKVESEFDYLRSSEEVKEYFDMKVKRSRYRINWKPSDQPLSIVKESWQNTNPKKHSFIRSILKRKDLKWLNFSTYSDSLCRSMTVADDEILLIRYDRRSSTNGSSTSVSFSRYHDIDEVQSIVAKEIIEHVGPFTAEEKKYIFKEWV